MCARTRIHSLDLQRHTPSRSSGIRAVNENEVDSEIRVSQRAPVQQTGQTGILQGGSLQQAGNWHSYMRRLSAILLAPYRPERWAGRGYDQTASTYASLARSMKRASDAILNKLSGMKTVGASLVQ